MRLSQHVQLLGETGRNTSPQTRKLEFRVFDSSRWSRSSAGILGVTKQCSETTPPLRRIMKSKQGKQPPQTDPRTRESSRPARPDRKHGLGLTRPVGAGKANPPYGLASLSPEARSERGIRPSKQKLLKSRSMPGLSHLPHKDRVFLHVPFQSPL